MCNCNEVQSWVLIGILILDVVQRQVLAVGLGLGLAQKREYDDRSPVRKPITTSGEPPKRDRYEIAA